MSVPVAPRKLSLFPTVSKSILGATETTATLTSANIAAVEAGDYFEFLPAAGYLPIQKLIATIGVSGCILF